MSLTSILSKFESIVRDAIVAHMSNNSLFAEEQHGFVPKRNCAIQLLVSFEAWNDIMEESGCVDIIYTDFSKAFDSVSQKSGILRNRRKPFEMDRFILIK